MCTNVSGWNDLGQKVQAFALAMEKRNRVKGAGCSATRFQADGSPTYRAVIEQTLCSLDANLSDIEAIQALSASENPLENPDPKLEAALLSAQENILDTGLTLMALHQQMEILPSSDRQFQAFFRLGGALQFAKDVIREARYEYQTEAGRLLKQYVEGRIASAPDEGTPADAMQIYFELSGFLAKTFPRNDFAPEKWRLLETMRCEIDALLDITWEEDDFDIDFPEMIDDMDPD